MTHLANEVTRRRLFSVNAVEELQTPFICTPEEWIEREG